MPRTASSPRRVRLVVLYGGVSAEHDVSCVSATNVLAALDQARYDIVPVAITRKGDWLVNAQAVQDAKHPNSGRPHAITAVGNPVDPQVALVSPDADLPTVVFPLVHGTRGEDGTLQGLLEMAGVAYVGSGVLGSAICMDKAMAKTLTGAHEIPQAKAFSLAASTDDVDALVTRAEMLMSIGEIDFPVFVKPANMGSSIGITKADNRARLTSALQTAFSYDERIVVEETVNGREIEVAVLGNEIGGKPPRASLPGEIVAGAEFYDYDDKYSSGVATLLIPAELDETETATIRELALEAYGALRCDGLARVDFFYEPRGRGFLLNEINTLPGFTAISMFPKLWAASGLSYGELIDELVELALDRHERRAVFRTDA